jgi:hypothetical protein
MENNSQAIILFDLQIISLYARVFYYCNVKAIKNPVKRKESLMDNNKNRIKDREKSNPELRKMKPKENADLGIANGQIIGVHEGKHERSRSEK